MKEKEMKMRKEEEQQQQQGEEEMGEDSMQHLRSKATELLIREEWESSVQAYSQFISLSQIQISKTHHQNPQPDLLSKLHKSLCLAFSNRAEARLRLRDFSEALRDCDSALEIETAHFKTLICRGKILLHLNRYSTALECFRTALLDPQARENSESLTGFLDRCRKLEIQARTGAFDLSDWVVNGFRGKSPELAEYIGAVEIKKSEIGGRGLFATKNIDSGTLLVCTKAIAIERAIIPVHDSGENARLVMWKNFIDKVTDSTAKCSRIRSLICTLSTGKDGDEVGSGVPDISLFRAETEEKSSCNSSSDERVERERIVSILDVNCLVEDAVSAKILGKKSDFYGVGLWVLPAFINHSCVPNSRRLHVGDHLMIHASRDIKAGEEITFPYFNVLSPPSNRLKSSQNWGFHCNCRRCRFENEICSKSEIKEIEAAIAMGTDMGGAVHRLEEGMRRWMVRGREKGYLRASFWGAFSEAFESEKFRKKWGRRVPATEAVVDSVVEAVGSDERVLKFYTEDLKRNGRRGCMVEMERAMKLGKGVYGKVIKKQAMKTLLEIGIHEKCSKANSF